MSHFKVIFTITFRQIIRSKKTLFMLIIAFLPVVIAIYYRISGREYDITPEQAVSFMMMFVMTSILLLVALFYGASLIADEVDNKTIIYLFTRPIRKYSIILAKYLAYLLSTIIILIPPAIITFLAITVGSLNYSDFMDSLAVFGKQVAVITAGLMVYGAIFLFLGTWRKHAMIIGLLFAFGWEKMILVVPGAVRRFSVVHYLLSIFPRGVLQSGFRILPPQANIKSSGLTSIIVLAFIFLAFISLSMFLISRKEYSFE